MKPYTFCILALEALAVSNNYGEDWVNFRIDFCRKFPHDLWSTRFGMDFFREVSSRLESGELIKSERGEKLGEYDLNFNKWLTANKLALY